MKKITALLAVLFILAGCAWFNKTIEKIAPSQTTVNGEIIPGTHSASPVTKDVADAIPYGNYALALLLLGVNFWQKVQSNKLEKGLSSTIQAIESAGKDPAISSAIAALKKDLSNAHQIANVQPLVNRIMQHLGFPADIKPLV